MDFIPYTYFSETELKSIKENLSSRTKEWVKEHFESQTPNAVLTVQSVSSPTPTSLIWNEVDLDALAFGSSNNNYAHVRVTATSNDWTVLFGLPNNNIKKNQLTQLEMTLLLNATAHSFLALLNNTGVASSLIISKEQLIQYSRVIGSGVLMLKLQLSGLLVESLVYGGGIKNANPNAPTHVESILRQQKLWSRAESCNDININLNATLGLTELSVGDISQISVGDIIKFDQLVSEPIKLFNAGGDLICHGSLCKQGEHKAVLVSKHY